MVVALLAGCGFFPGSGPREQAINANASASLRTEGDTVGYEYVVVDVTRSLLPAISVDSKNEFRTFGAARNVAPSIRIGPGDIVRVTVFESQSGGLFLPEDAGARPGNFVQLPPQRVDQEGRISVPFAGVIRAAGQTTSGIERIIRERLDGRAIEPEVSVEIVEQNFSRISVIGNVAGGGVFPIRDGGIRILEAIAQAGGISGPASSSFVTLRRGQESVKVEYRAITENPKENIYLGPGDVLEVTVEERSFFAFGATGLIGNFDFGADKVSLNEAVARVASVLETRANPRQILIYRNESRHALERMGVDLSNLRDPNSKVINTIYRLNYRSPDIFFLGHEFTMRDADVIFVTNAAVVDILTFFNGVNSVIVQPLQTRNNIQSY
ncbi:MAG: polysaccharide biosynthesis/export family protein [Paracoccaceae bacterium]